MKAISIISAIENLTKWFQGIKKFSLFVITFALIVTSSLIEVKAQVPDSVITVVDRVPAFRGKPSNVRKFLQQQLVYPDEAWRNGIEGVVQISGVVSKDGVLMNTFVENSIDPQLDMEALRLVDLMTEWRPAMRKGEVVHSRVLIPVDFSLSADEREFVNNLKKYGLNNNPPLYIIDDKIVQSRLHLPSYNVRSIRVLKGDVAIEKYGDEAKNGVVIVTTKRGTPPVR
jgi:TonB family protein